MKLFIKMIILNSKASLQYKASFVLDLITSTAMMFSEFFVIYLLIYNAGDIYGWSAENMAMMYVITMLASSLESSFSSGMREFSREIIDGTLDMKLLRPVHPIILLLGRTRIMALLDKIGLCFGIIAYLTIHYKIHWTIYKIVWMMISVIGGSLIFLGLAIFSAAISFWTYDSDSIYRLFKNGTRQILWYPISIYSGIIKTILVFIVPLAFVSYFPTFIFSGMPLTEFPSFFPYINILVGLIVVVIGITIWNIGLKRYESVG